jgi:hypothetical protein
VSTTSDLFENINEDDELWLADIETMTINLGQELSAWREARQRALTDDDYGAGDRAAPPEEQMSAEEEMSADEPFRPGRIDRSHHDRPPSSMGAATIYPVGMGEPRAARRQPRTDQRTRSLIDQGRRSARPPRRLRRHPVTVGVVLLTVIAAVLVVLVFRKSATWPGSVATVQSEITTACQNPDVAAEPDQVNFACEKSTSQILWVFSLMTSGDNPAFSDAKSGREGLEPITPGMGGEVAWSLNLHHPYNPLNPIDSLEVAARAINNIVGGAAITASNGKLTVQPGLESNPANCARYTGSPAVVARAGFPDVCAQPITSGSGQAALVSDIYGQWLVGSPPAAAQEASVLFENANNPGNPMVQAILRTLPAANGS